ncbi:connector enhancer of kinase suppressor of ras 1 isoform X1 [Pangasianodon hypophthalmus]|uniref:connector enhancer of kinase suppressor of ras 1 isoform X1 n=1 Tax=Pangasianodon hypophthalmus TaxID=310915 RepID=UPI0023071CD0|nr:connector enhancer of kinase suppressor of ras 1 isoform X1 [Pangasianodon hypophthalmus]
MEPITSWSAERVSAWLRGLDASLQQYAFEQWRLCGVDLLQLSSQQLEQLGVHKIGHQELILDAVEKLCTMTYGLAGENVGSVAEKLRAVAHSLQMGIQSRWRVNTYDGHRATKMPNQQLQLVLDLIVTAKALYSLLNGYQYTELTGYTGFKNILELCKDLGSAVQKDNTVLDKEKDIISVSRQLVAICDEVLSAAPEAVLTHTSQLQSVDLVPVLPGEQLGIEITSTSSSQHYISGTAAEFPADSAEKILAGDEVIKVNDQIVVGWSRKNLVAKLQENPNGVTLLLRRLPALSVSHKHKDKPAQKEEEDEEEEERNRHSVFERAPVSVRSYSFRAAVLSPEGQQLTGQEELELSGLDGNQSHSAHTHHLGAGSGLERRSTSLLSLDSSRTRVGSWPDMGASMEEKEPKKSSFKGTRTALSRRRVSCRELGLPDCDGWLWKKRKEMSVFMTQKWQRFWFVLKGVTIYWYTSQQEEKAVGMVKIGSYSIESAGEHKRKYVFKMCHPRFQNFFFAADNVNDMSKWINCLITAIQKYKKHQQNPSDNETECYSETESEEDGSHSPRLVKKKPSTKAHSNTLPRALGKKNKPLGGGAVTTSPAGGSKAAGTVDEMGELFNKLKEGGVSLIGQNQPITHDQLRRSFIRRNKNPVINEKIHTLRALQSTLKAKEAELQLIDKLLEDSSLTPLKFRQWKQNNDDLYQEIEKIATEKKHNQTTPQVKTATADDDGACRLSLSDGEQLVDAELPSDGDSALDSGREHLAGLTDPHSQRADSSSSENYFYI